MPELTVVEVLRRIDAPADPRPEFADPLLASLLDELAAAPSAEPEATLEPGTTTSAPLTPPRSRRPWLRVALAAAAAFAIAVVIVVQLPSGRQDAVAVMRDARATFASLPAFHATTYKRVPGAWLQDSAPELERPVPDQVFEREISYMDATHFRHEVTSVTWGADGSRALLAQLDVQEGEYWVADGKYFASYVPSANSLAVEPIRDPADLRFFAAGELDPEVEYFADPGDWYIRQYCEVLPDDTMLGRTVRRIHCLDPRMRQYEGGPVLDVDVSIDAATGMLLELESRNEGLLFAVTSLDLAPPFAGDEFRIVPPEGAAIDWRGGGAPPARFAPEVDATVTASIPIGNAPTVVAADDGVVWAGAYEGGEGDWPVGGI
ncbi:MAG TPA: hypothetical protein VFT27_03915, partial [Actinomycetota bacterium]|nr:hypothetical protein [Actinomycetota bacterium]